MLPRTIESAVLSLAREGNIAVLYEHAGDHWFAAGEIAELTRTGVTGWAKLSGPSSWIRADLSEDVVFMTGVCEAGLPSFVGAGHGWAVAQAHGLWLACGSSDDAPSRVSVNP